MVNTGRGRARRSILVWPGRLRDDLVDREAEKQIPHPARKGRERVRDDNWESIGGRAAKLSVARVLGNEQKLRSAGILSLQLGEALGSLLPDRHAKLLRVPERLAQRSLGSARDKAALLQGLTTAAHRRKQR
jgi:hypothetical protein